MQKLTDRQRAVLEFISESISDRGFPPTLREIGNRLGIRSTNGVNDHLRALERKGYLTREDMKSRTLRLVRTPDGRTMSEGEDDDLPDLDANGDLGGHGLRGVTSMAGLATRAANDADDDLLTIPIVGRVAAGLLAEAIQHPEDSVRIDRMLVGGNRDVFGLRIVGESMIEAGIHDGDYVFVRKQLTANRGEIVIALVGEEATCKYYYPERDHIRLQPANSTMAPILIPKTDWRSTQIMGVVVGIYRRLH
ncbi:MAG: transcriptional repressor LexA [Sandaracinaceae bacterium]|jgi:repressor LexA|nr:transcriptional repressor LexA [Sandaracinaceae bacterium]MBK7775522.1 transcriptional repressor LexA [Sandaracinaceae bacterium]MBK8406500.1 transcriptional repressor LexA [Sandaracinaceae bacterium]MBK8590083.1 transcriptional repressor LexA [Sandaracinaceae bacterium]